jgi:hypothetical protein
MNIINEYCLKLLNISINKNLKKLILKYAYPSTKKILKLYKYSKYCSQCFIFLDNIVYYFSQNKYICIYCSHKYYEYEKTTFCRISTGLPWFIGFLPKKFLISRTKLKAVDLYKKITNLFNYIGKCKKCKNLLFGGQETLKNLKCGLCLTDQKEENWKLLKSSIVKFSSSKTKEELKYNTILLCSFCSDNIFFKIFRSDTFIDFYQGQDIMKICEC